MIIRKKLINKIFKIKDTNKNMSKIQKIKLKKKANHLKINNWNKCKHKRVKINLKILKKNNKALNKKN
jgi:hypothetical protein